MAVVWICGGTMLGNCAIGSRKIITPPAMTKKIAITIATVGCRMKNRDMLLTPARRRGSHRWLRSRAWQVLLRWRGGHQMRVHLDTIVNLLQSFSDDMFAG